MPMRCGGPGGEGDGGRKRAGMALPGATPSSAVPPASLVGNQSLQADRIGAIGFAPISSASECAKDAVEAALAPFLNIKIASSLARIRTPAHLRSTSLSIVDGACR